MFVGVAKSPIANTFSGSVEMDFVDYGDYTAFLHIRDTFSRFPAIILRGGWEEEQTAESPRGKVVSNWLAALLAPGLIAADKDSIFVVEVMQDFGTSRNIALQAVIRGQRQSFGGH